MSQTEQRLHCEHYDRFKDLFGKNTARFRGRAWNWRDTQTHVQP